jgi:hypothetical protein
VNPTNWINMRKPKGLTPRRLIRQEATLELDPHQWPRVLLALQDAGWTPQRSSLWFLASGTMVSDDEAREMSQVADILFHAPLDDPRWALSLQRPLDMDVFLEVKEFLRFGAFRIE